MALGHEWGHAAKGDVLESLGEDLGSEVVRAGGGRRAAVPLEQERRKPRGLSEELVRRKGGGADVPRGSLGADGHRAYEGEAVEEVAAESVRVWE